MALTIALKFLLYLRVSETAAIRFLWFTFISFLVAKLIAYLAGANIAAQITFAIIMFNDVTRIVPFYLKWFLKTFYISKVAAQQDNKPI